MAQPAHTPQDVVALHAACRHAPQVFNEALNSLSDLQLLAISSFQTLRELEQDSREQLRLLVQTRRVEIAARLDVRGWCSRDAFIDITDDIGLRIDRISQCMTDRLLRMDRTVVALMGFAALRGGRDARVALISAVTARIFANGSKLDTLRRVLLVVLLTFAPMTALRVLRRVLRPFLGERLPSFMAKAALAWAIVSNPGPSTFSPQPRSDVWKLRALLSPTFPLTVADSFGDESIDLEQTYAESFGLFTLASMSAPKSTAPIFLGDDRSHHSAGQSSQHSQPIGISGGDRELEALLTWMNDPNPQMLYYVGVYDRWMCVNVALARCTLHVLRVLSTAVMTPRKVVWSYCHGGSTSEPPPDYTPFPAEDADHQCVICLDSRKDTVMRPCGHLCSCWYCGQSVEGKCPVCRGPVLATDYVGRVYH